MDLTGVVFDIEQFAVNDGPGVRTTVFLKGCPLRCAWCHNPEGLSPAPQMLYTKGACRNCGRCAGVCEHPEHCTACGSCAAVCPYHARRISGVRYRPETLAALLLQDRAYLMGMGGGVTFSGGEPTMQGEFLYQTLELLQGMHTAIETCGYCDGAVFERLLTRLDYVLMDIKIANGAAHRRYTGVDNAVILQNLQILKNSGKPFIIRVPLIPGITDTAENLSAIADLLMDAPMLERVELLPYHQTAGVKYGMVGKRYDPPFDETRPVNRDMSPFLQRGLACRVL